ncbi:hypothetical protein C8Q80DRAFT_1248204 [Daedaleopsis nitida]|nr:hypothetical protein C8Q80DRAFT_1248204 [Daedaleopsis nitida]
MSGKLLSCIHPSTAAPHLLPSALGAHPCVSIAPSSRYPQRNVRYLRHHPSVASAEELTKTFGVLLIGFIFSVVLYGLTFFQTYIYFTRFPSDALGTKAVVGVLWAMDTAATTLMSHTIYLYLITGFSLSFDQLVTTHTFVAEEAVGALIIFVVQAYFAYRVWAVSNRSIALPVVIGALAAVSVALNLAGVSQLSRQTWFAEMVSSRVKLYRGVASALSVATNTAISAAMFYNMTPTRNPGMAVPQTMFEKVVVMCFNRATALIAIQILCLIFFLADSKGQAWILLNWVAIKIYANSLIGMLNFRNTHRGRGVHEEDSLNQHASNRSGSMTDPHVPRETARSVQFGVHPDAKTVGEPANIIELDMVASHHEHDDDDSGKHAPSIESGSPSKHPQFDEES